MILSLENTENDLSVLVLEFSECTVDASVGGKGV